MSVTFKKVLRKDPFHKDGTGKYYPQLIVWGKSATLESIAVQMKESSSLTLGDIQSVITNFVGAMRHGTSTASGWNSLPSRFLSVGLYTCW